MIKNRREYIEKIIDKVCSELPWATKERMTALANPYLREVAYNIIDDWEKDYKRAQKQLDKMHQHFIDNMPL